MVEGEDQGGVDTQSRYVIPSCGVCRCAALRRRNPLIFARTDFSILFQNILNGHSTHTQWAIPQSETREGCP